MYVGNAFIIPERARARNQSENLRARSLKTFRGVAKSGLEQGRDTRALLSQAPPQRSLSFNQMKNVQTRRVIYAEVLGIVRNTTRTRLGNRRDVTKQGMSRE